MELLDSDVLALTSYNKEMVIINWKCGYIIKDLEFPSEDSCDIIKMNESLLIACSSNYLSSINILK
jgi:hypothetical protein